MRLVCIAGYFLNVSFNSTMNMMRKVTPLSAANCRSYQDMLLRVLLAPF